MSRRAGSLFLRCARPFCSAANGGTGRSAQSTLSTIAVSSSGPASDLLVPLWRSTLAKASTCAVNPAVSRRGFVSRAEGELVDKLQDELDHENEQGETAVANPPSPFKLVDEPGSGRLIARATRGKEEIEVVARIGGVSEVGYDEDEALEDQGEEDEEARPAAESVEFMVTVRKGAEPNSQELVFDCSATGSEVVVHHVNLEDADSTNQEEAYHGPEYSLLDPDLQAKFDEYLEARGVNSKLAAWLLQAIQDKEQKEYVSWLGKVRSFVKK